MDERRIKWMNLAEKLDGAKNCPYIREGEIWWVAVGKNIGIEINGKSERFSRPVLIFKKLSNLGFLGIPLTSQRHVGTWYVEFEFQGRQDRAILAQARVFSAARLYARMGFVAEDDLKRITEGFRKLYLDS